jgi:hypothetical protein
LELGFSVIAGQADKIKGVRDKCREHFTLINYKPCEHYHSAMDQLIRELRRQLQVFRHVQLRVDEPLKKFLVIADNNTTPAPIKEALKGRMDKLHENYSALQKQIDEFSAEEEALKKADLSSSSSCSSSSTTSSDSTN